MSMTEKEILTRLQKGETMDSILKEITDTVNNANTEYQKQQKANAEKAKKEKEKETILKELTEKVNNYLSVCDIKKTATSKQVKDCIDNFIVTTDFVDILTDLFTDLKKNKKKDFDDDIFGIGLKDFLN